VGRKGANGVEIFDLYTQFIAVGMEGFTCKRLRRSVPITMTLKARRTYITAADN
jgi:hypothetical protein